MTLPINPAGVPNLPPPSPAGGAGPVGGGGAPGVEFGQKMNSPQAAEGSQKVGEAGRVEFKDGTNPLDQAQGIREEISRIRGEYESQIAKGEIKPGDGQAQIWRLMDLQTRAQDVHFRVELVTKLIDNVSGGIKQLSQTQA